MSEALNWLIQWHNAHPGATSSAFASAQPSSYALLAEQVRPGDLVLDLACGDGFLLEQMRARGAATLIGVDASPGELAAARARLGPGVDLRQGLAQTLPLPDASVDLVSCHLALMLMNPVEPVIAELARVLRPGGRFAAVLPGPGAPADAWSMVIRRVSGLDFQGPRLSDRRVYEPEALLRLLSPLGAIEVRELLLDVSGDADALWRLFLLSYDAVQLGPQALAKLEADLRADWSGLSDENGQIPCFIGVRMVIAAVPGIAR